MCDDRHQRAEIEERLLSISGCAPPLGASHLEVLAPNQSRRLAAADAAQSAAARSRLFEFFREVGGVVRAWSCR